MTMPSARSLGTLQMSEFAAHVHPCTFIGSGEVATPPRHPLAGTRVPHQMLHKITLERMEQCTCRGRDAKTGQDAIAKEPPIRERPKHTINLHNVHWRQLIWAHSQLHHGPQSIIYREAIAESGGDGLLGESDAGRIHHANLADLKGGQRRVHWGILLAAQTFVVYRNV